MHCIYLLSLFIQIHGVCINVHLSAQQNYLNIFAVIMGQSTYIRSDNTNTTNITTNVSCNIITLSMYRIDACILKHYHPTGNLCIIRTASC